MLDIREHGPYGEGHPFLAVPCPFSRLEVLVPQLVPRASVPIVLVDDGDGLAGRAAAILGGMGYGDVSWIEGGAPAWAAAGFTLFKGVNLPSKTLGELLEQAWHVPHIDIETLARWQEEGRAHQLFDGRPAAEYGKTTIPGALCAPNGELGHRLGPLLREGDVPVVVHCAGRTRSIVGAASLALAGAAQPVYALENGTQGWALSGRALQRGAVAAPLPEPDAGAKAAGAAQAVAVARRYAIAFVDVEGVRRMAADPDRTLFLLDVRSAEEFAAGSLPGAVHAPAVQLAQATDQWLGVRRARVVLADDTGLRASIAAVFLGALGYEVAVLRDVDRLCGASPIVRPSTPTAPAREPVPTIDAAEALAALARGGTLLDLRGSMAFRAAHLAGARWTIRPVLPSLASGTPVTLVGAVEVVALAAADLRARGIGDVRHVAGGPHEWRAAGLSVLATPGEPADAEAIDHLFFVHDRHEGNMESARRYLAWEQGLIAALDPAERGSFSIGPSPFPEPGPSPGSRAP